MKRHNYTLGLHGYQGALCNGPGWCALRAKRSAHRKKRPRRPLVGMMLHQDGSPHVWLEGQPPIDFIVTHG